MKRFVQISILVYFFIISTFVVGVSVCDINVPKFVEQTNNSHTYSLVLVDLFSKQFYHTNYISDDNSVDRSYGKNRFHSGCILSKTISVSIIKVQNGFESLKLNFNIPFSGTSIIFPFHYFW